MRLIDADAVKREYPIMENDFGMIVNDRLHDILDNSPTIQAVPIEELQKIRKEIEHLPNANPSYWNKCDVVDREDTLEIIDTHIKEFTNETDN